MITKIKEYLAVFKNLNKIKQVVPEFHFALVKTISCLVFIQSETNNTKLGKTLEKYLPVVIEILEKIKTIIENYGPLLGITVGAELQNINISEDTLLEELNKTNASLSTLL